MSGKLCVISGCREPGQHQPACHNRDCTGCQPRLAGHGHVCSPHATRLAADLTDIPAWVAQLAEDPDPTDHTTWQVAQVPVPTTNPNQLPTWARADGHTSPGSEPLAQLFPMGITRQGRGAPVSGSREAPTPLGTAGINRLDLLAPSRPGSIHGIPDTDQTGYLSVATELDFWVRDWLGGGAPGEHLPPPTVAALASWLSTRLPWACEYHYAIDEFAAKLSHIRSALRAALGLNPARKELCIGVVCRSCDRVSLYRDQGYIQCGSCDLYYSDRDYTEWTGLLAAQTRHRIKTGELQNPRRIAA